MAKKKDSSTVEEVVESKGSAIKAAEEAVRKKFGIGAAFFLSEFKDRKRDIISTGSVGLDYAIGIGGIPCGRMIEIYGPPSSGKTTLALSIGAQSHLVSDRDVLFVDAEHALDLGLVRSVGLKDDRMVIIDRPTAEENLTVAETYIKTGKFSIVIIDSVASLVPQAEFDASYDDQFMGLHPRLMSRMCRTIKPLCNKTNTTLILINQTRDKIGTYAGGKETTGGNAIKFYSDVRIEVTGGTSKSTLIKDMSDGAGDDDFIGHKTTFKIVKNKVGRPWKTCEIDLIYGEGYDTIGELVTLGEDLGFLNVSGAWYEYNGIKAQGKIKFKQALLENTELIEKLKSDILTVLRG